MGDELESEIRDADDLLRIVTTQDWIVPDGSGGYRLASGALKGKKRDDGSGDRVFSMYVERLLEEGGYTGWDVMPGRTLALAALTAESLRTEELAIDLAPEDEAGEFASAHADVSGSLPDSRRTRLAGKADVRLPDDLVAPPIDV
jgi:hypothetical protein